MSEYSPTETRIAQLNPGYSPDDVKAVAALQGSLLARHSEKTELLASTSKGTQFCVLGAHANRNFFTIKVEAENDLCAFGAAALLLKEAGEDGDAEFYAAFPADVALGLPGDGVVTLDTVLDPEQAEVFGLDRLSQK